MGWETQKENIKESKEEIIAETPKVQFKSLAEAEKKRGLKIGIYGDFATGKTHFALTAPTPVYIIDTELGAPPLSHMFKNKDIKVLDVIDNDGVKSFQNIKEAIDMICNEKNVGTVIIDSASDLWSFAQEYVKVNIFKIRPDQRLAQQWDWHIINKEYLRLILKLLKKDCNLILTGRVQEVYAGAGQPTGIYKPKWMNQTAYWMDMVLYNTKKIDKMGNASFSSRIEKCRNIGKLMGKSFSNLEFEKIQKEVLLYKNE